MGDEAMAQYSFCQNRYADTLFPHRSEKAKKPSRPSNQATACWI
jgi:hypothetical protein